MVNNTSMEKDNMTDQMYKEMSDHFMVLVGKMKTLIKIQKDMTSIGVANYYDLADELQSRAACIDDSTLSIDSDLEEFIENYSELEIEDLE